MSIGSIAVSGIGYGALAVALSGFVSSGAAGPLVGEGLDQANELGTGYITQIGTIPEPGMTTRAAETSGIKKPGIPNGTPDWLKTMLETVIGRRGNAIEVPKFQTLTFSASPTKAECEAMYAYTNDVRRAVEDILTRLDS